MNIKLTSNNHQIKQQIMIKHLKKNSMLLFSADSKIQVLLKSIFILPSKYLYYWLQQKILNQRVKKGLKSSTRSRLIFFQRALSSL